MIRKTRCFRAIVGIALLSVSTTLAETAGNPHEGKLIADIRVEGAKQVGINTILARCRSHKGDYYAAETVRGDVKRILDTHRFDNVEIFTQPSNGKVILIVKVTERPLVTKIQIVGNKHFKTADLLAEVGLTAGEFLDPYRAQRGRQRILTQYHEAAFYFAKVALDARLLKRKREVKYTITEGPRLYINAVKFIGNKTLSSGALQGKINSLPWFPIIRSGRLNDEKLAEDVANLADYYRQKGFFDVRVDVRKVFNPARTRVKLEFLLHEGVRYKVHAFLFEGNQTIEVETLKKDFKLEIGKRFDREKQDHDVKKIVDAYGRKGYIYARVDPAHRFLDRPGLVDIVFRVKEGESYTVGLVHIRGNVLTQDRVVRRHVKLVPGKTFDSVAMRKSERRLLETRLFARARISPLGREPEVRDAMVEIEETETATFLVGVGVTSDAGVLGNISLEQRNFDLFGWPKKGREFFKGEAFRGAGQTFRIQAEPGTELSRFRIDFREPWVFDQPISFAQTIYYFTRGREVYDEQRLGAVWSLGRRFPNHWGIEGAFRIENVNINNLDDEVYDPRDPIEDILDARGGNGVVAFKGTVIYDRTDSFWMPSEGYKATVSYEQVAGTWSFGRINAGFRYHWTLHEDLFERKSILTVKTRGGAIVGDAPMFERYYLGGIATLRGFDFRGVSPRDGVENRQIGGDWMFTLGTEYSFPVYAENLRGVFFLDTGTTEGGTYRAAIGCGLRVIVPMFGPVPLAFDFAVPVAKDPLDDTRVFSFSIGAIF